MAHQFLLRQGVVKPTSHSTEKFLMFFVLGGDEIPFYRVQKEGLVTPAAHADPWAFNTNLNVAKIFIGQSGFNIPSRYHSFYIQFRDPPAPMVTVKSFGGDDTIFTFEGRIRFLEDKEVLELLNKDCSSYRFIGKQSRLPPAILKELVTVDKTEQRKGVRHIRLGHGRKRAEEQDDTTIDDLLAEL